jgi:hypothetical protein
MSEFKPAREYYTAQEISDLLFEFGAQPTLVHNEDEVVMLELERGTDTLQLDFGPPREFYDEVLCRSWVFVSSAPHRACDRWNEFPYFGTFSVVYDDHDAPVKTEAGFGIRGVIQVSFDRCKSESDLVMQILMFWFGLSLIQELVTSGETNLAKIDRMTVLGEFGRWWLGEE